jgi:hypothetical protein
MDENVCDMTLNKRRTNNTILDKKQSIIQSERKNNATLLSFIPTRTQQKDR